MDMMSKIYEKARKNPQRVAFAEAIEPKILQAAYEALSRGIAKPLLVGDPQAIRAAAAEVGVSLEGMKIVDGTDAEEQDRRIAQYMETGSLLSEKGLKRRCRDPLYYALILQALGIADVTFAGLAHTTGEVILAGQTVIGMRPDVGTISSVGVFDIPGYDGSEGQLVAFADSAVCTAPDENELADIAISACDTIRALFEWEPRCALLSFSTDGSNEHPYVEKIRNAVRLAQTRRPDLKIDGEFQLDAAISPAVASRKVKRDSDVAGRANIIIWPDINAGNIGVKLVQYFAHANAYGPMLQGFRKIVCDCSRGAPLEEIVGNVAMSVVRAQKQS